MHLEISSEHWLHLYEEHEIPRVRIKNTKHDKRSHTKRKCKVCHEWWQFSIVNHVWACNNTFSNISEDLWTFPISEIIDRCCRRFTLAIFSSSSTTLSSSCLAKKKYTIKWCYLGYLYICVLHQWFSLHLMVSFFLYLNTFKNHDFGER